MFIVLLGFPSGQSQSVSVRFGEKTAVSAGFDFDFLPVPWILNVAAENQLNLRQNKLTAH